MEVETRGGRAGANFEDSSRRCRAGSASGAAGQWTNRGAAKRTPAACRLLSSCRFSPLPSPSLAAAVKASRGKFLARRAKGLSTSRAPLPPTVPARSISCRLVVDFPQGCNLLVPLPRELACGVRSRAVGVRPTPIYS